MTTETQQTMPDEPVKRTVFYDLSRKILLAAIGGAAIASDEIARFVTKLAERGEIAEKDARALIREVFESREKLEKEQKETAEQKSNQASRAEIEDLNARIAELNKKIEELKKTHPEKETQER
jgi:polyhydroxyalkanoate synthesis regulator phasin